MSIGGDFASGQSIDSSIAQDVDIILSRFRRFGVHLGLERIEQLLADLGNPHQQVPIIHVAGTNGKGSVCAYLSNVLTQAGYQVGRYTSPHLVSWCERICINGQPIALETLRSQLRQVQAAISPHQTSPTQFEVFTAAAWLYFAQQRVDVAVVEVGLGGRLDATNVCDCPLVSIITSISRDHWQRLGPTLADIAREKAGILKPNCPAVVGPLPPEAKAIVQQRITALQCPALWPQPAQTLENGWAEYSPIPPNPSSPIPHTPHPTPHSLRYSLKLLGQHQLTNSALAIAALFLLQKQGWHIPEDTIIEGIAKTQWPGRLQWVVWQNNQIARKLLIDGAHNAAAAQALRQYVDSLSAKSVLCPPPAARHTSWLMGMLSTKDHAAIFKALLRPGDRLHLAPVPGRLSAEPEELGAIAQSICPDLAVCQAYPDLASALEAATTHDQTEHSQLTVLCGSLYLVGHFLGKFRSVEVKQ